MSRGLENSKPQMFAILTYNRIESTNKVTVGHKQSNATAFQQELENEFQYCICKNTEYYGIRIFRPIYPVKTEFTMPKKWEINSWI